jgi:hypothetical protein
MRTRPADDVAAADHDVQFVITLQRIKHWCKPGFVMLQIRIDYGAKWGRGGQNAFDTGPGEAPPPDPLDYTDIV